MITKRMLTNCLLGIVLVSGLFLSPLHSQEARAASPVQAGPTASLHFLTTPPEKMCLDDTAPIIFSVKWSGFSPQKGGAVTPGSGVAVSLTATASKGTLPVSSWSFPGNQGSAMITVEYQAKEEGAEQIAFVLSSATRTGKSALPFTIITCQKTIILGASDSVTGIGGSVDTYLEGQGGISISNSKNGVVTGGGTFRYNLAVSFEPPSSAYTCASYATSSADSTFTVSGKSLHNNVYIEFNFSKFELPPCTARCVDKAGTVYKFQQLDAQTIDPNPALNLGGIAFEGGVGTYHFAFGKGSGDIYMFNRKGSGK